jgi:hypothetical protein
MRPLPRAARLVAGSATVTLVAALAWLPVGAASASVQNNFFALADGNSSYTGAGVFDCTLTAGVDNPQSLPATFSSGTKSRSVNLNQTYTSTANSADATTVIGHYKGSLSVSTRHGDLAGFTMSGSGSATITKALGNSSQCRTGAVLGVESQTSFTESKPGWLYVTRDTGMSAETLFVAANQTTMSPVLFEIYFGNASKATARGFLTPGSYVIPEWLVAMIAGDGGGIAKNAPGGGTVERSSLGSRMTGTFYAAGSAFGGTKGAAGRFVRFPGSISCAHHTAKLTWTAHAGQVARGSFFVNGKKKASVDSPRAGHSVVLRHLSTTADNTIKARLTLGGGGKASAARAYVPCKG